MEILHGKKSFTNTIGFKPTDFWLKFSWFSVAISLHGFVQYPYGWTPGPYLWPVLSGTKLQSLNPLLCSPVTLSEALTFYRVRIKWIHSLPSSTWDSKVCLNYLAFKLRIWETYSISCYAIFQTINTQGKIFNYAIF